MDTATTLDTRRSQIARQIKAKLRELNKGSFVEYKAIGTLIESGERFVIECIFEEHRSYANSRTKVRGELGKILSAIPGTYGAEMLQGRKIDAHWFQIAFKVR